MTIEHLVISGGCIWGLYEYGILKQLHKKEFWKTEDIKSVYATSAGAVVGAVLLLKPDFDIIDQYLVERPWHQVWKENSYHLLEAYHACGVFHKQTFYELFSPILKSIDLSVDITIQEFYDWSGVDLNIFTTELNAFEPVLVNQKTYPDWKLIDAIYASCTLPAIFAPIIKDNKCYIDGGFFNNYPLKPCFIEVEDHDTILGICIEGILDANNREIITEDSNIIDFTGLLMHKILKNLLFLNDNTGMIKHEIISYTGCITIGEMQKVASSKEERLCLIQMGENDALKYYDKWVIEPNSQIDQDGHM